MVEQQNVADGVWYTDLATGERKWATGEMLFAHVASAIDARSKADGRKNNKGLEKVADAVAKLYAALRRENRELREEVGALRAELNELRGNPPLRAVK